MNPCCTKDLATFLCRAAVCMFQSYIVVSGDAFPLPRCSPLWYPLVSRCSLQGYVPEPRCSFRGYAPVPRCSFRGYAPVPRCSFRGYAPVLRCSFRGYAPVSRCSPSWYASVSRCSLQGFAARCRDTCRAADFGDILCRAGVLGIRSCVALHLLGQLHSLRTQPFVLAQLLSFIFTVLCESS